MPHRVGAESFPCPTRNRHGLRVSSILVMLLLASMAASGCLDASSGPSDPDIVATAYPLTFIANRIAGDDLDIRTVYPQTERPFGWEPGSQDRKLLTNARVVLHTGGVIDPWAMTHRDPQASGHTVDITRGIGLPEAVHLHSVLHGAGWGEDDDHDHGHDHGHSHGHGHDHGHGDGHGHGGPSPSQVLITGDEFTHTFTSDSIDALVDSVGIIDEADGTRTIPYHCHLHPWKEGVISVLNGTVPEGPTLHEVSIIDHGPDDLSGMSFDPPVIQIHEGDTIRWVNNGLLQHTITPGEGHGPGEGPETLKARTIHVDPHFWVDPLRMMKAVNNTVEALVALNSQQEDVYRARADEFNAGLQGIHERYRYGLRQCETRHMFLTEEAFGGISHRYNLYQHPLRTLEDPLANPLKNVQGVAHLARSLEATHIFLVDPSDAGLAQVFSMETGTQVVTIDTMRDLDSQRVLAGESYFSVMDENLENIRNALRCL